MPEPDPQPSRSGLDLGLLLAAALTATACMGPWARVRSADLFGTTGEISAYLTPPGLMTLLAATLTALLVGLARNATRSPETANALSAALLVPALAGCGALLVQWVSGPGDYRAAPMVRTDWFYFALVAAIAMASMAIARWKAFGTALADTATTAPS